MSENGYVLTNAHVIADCFRVIITTEDKTEYEALLVGRDEQSDLAVLKIDAQGLTPAESGTPTRCR